MPLRVIGLALDAMFLNVALERRTIPSSDAAFPCPPSQFGPGAQTVRSEGTVGLKQCLTCRICGGESTVAYCGGCESQVCKEHVTCAGHVTCAELCT